MKTKTAAIENAAPQPTPSGNKEAAAVLAHIMEAPVEQLRKKVSDFKTKKERLHFVADMIERAALAKENIGFNMGKWKMRASPRHGLDDKTGHRCGTIACISGWTGILEDGNESDGMPRRSKYLLKLTDLEARALFYGRGRTEFKIEDLTDKQAVSVLRHFADHGEVRWDLFRPDGSRREP